MIRLALLATFALLLSSCISHYFVGEEVRWQIENQSDKEVTALMILGQDTIEVLSADSFSVAPGERSRVYTKEGIGRFEIGVVVGEDTLRKNQEWMASSYIIRTLDESLKIKER